VRKTALIAWLLVALSVPARGRAEVKVGDSIDQSNADEVKDLLPPEIHRHYKAGEYMNKLVDFPNAAFKRDDGFDESTEWDRQHVTLDAAKQPVDKDTGKRPDWISGIPFPDIKQDDPDAGVKVLWDSNYSTYNGGNSRNVTVLDWVSPTALDRSSTQDVVFLFYDGQPKKYIPANPQNYLFQFIAMTLSPTDLQGTAALSYRYREPGKRDSSWAYVPALRRIRAVSPTNRSDGFLGSDLSQDDGTFFDGKPEDFTWRLVDHRDALRFTDPDAIAGKVIRKALPGGGWRTHYAHNEETCGYQVKGWKGIAWAPVQGALTKRKMWVVEGVPKDKYYLYGKIELWVDDFTWQGAWNRKFSWRGELLNTYQVTGPPTAPYDDKERWWGSTFGWQTAENVKANRATVAGMEPPGDVASDRRMPLAPSFFDYQTLNRFGK
jgi:hypothetical protein